LVLELSRAEQQMVEIAKAFRTKLQVLILDEPTASLTERETERLFELIAQAKATDVGVVYITHRMAEIRRIADRITILRDGRRVATVRAGEVGDDTLIEMMTGRPIAQIFPTVRVDPGEVLLEVEGMRTADGSVAGVSLAVRRAEIVGLAGLVGSGKSEIARACFGAVAVVQGRVRFKGENVTGSSPREMLGRGLFYVPPDRREEGLVLIRDTIENVSLPALGEASFSAGWWLRRRQGRDRVADLARRLNLQPFDLSRDVGHFSGGNQQKVLLAKALSREVELFVFDEPTVGVDVGTRAEIYRFIARLCESGAGILLISSDLPEIVHLAHRAYVLFRGRLQAELEGDGITEDEVLRHCFERAA
jgi:ribose transport system ATP-binding protein